MLPLLAVVGRGQGAVIDARVWVRIPGRDIFITRPVLGVGEDTALSARIALYYAALLNHIDPTRIDAGVEFINEQEVSGASAGLPLFLGYYALLSNKYINTSVLTGTGLLSPNGLVVNVGGVVEKIRAGLANGLKQFLIPYSDYEQYRVRLESLNATIHPVCSVESALVYTFNSPDVNASITIPETYFKRAAFELITVLNKTIALATNTSLASRNNLVGMLREYLREAIKLAKRGYYYTSASIAYSGLVEFIQEASINLVDNLTRLILSSIDRKKLAEEIYILKAEVMRRKHVPLWRLEALMSAEYRLYAAAKLLSSNDPRLKALGALRLMTVVHWLDAAKSVTGPLIDSAAFRRAVKLLVNYADLATKYIESLIKSKKVKLRNAEMIPISTLQLDMHTALLQGDYIRAGALALNILGLVTSSLAGYDLASGTPPTILRECALKQLQLHEAITGLRSFNADIMADYALHTPFNESSALIADQASTYSLLLLVLSVSEGTLQATSKTSDMSLLVAIILSSLLSSMAVGAGLTLALRKEVE